MNRLLFSTFAVVLPVAGLLGSIAVNQASLRNATEWRIPITGYDPRDPLRGHYVMFRYVWWAEGDYRLCKEGDDCRLCLENGGERVRIASKDSACAAPIDLAASGLRVNEVQNADPARVTAAARLWVSEARAPLLERQLRSRPMVAVARLTSGGRLIADRLAPAR